VNYTVLQIKNEETYPWLKKKHYAKRIPHICFAFGLYKDKDLIGVITYGIPASDALCRGICGDNYKHMVLELNRLCLQENKKNEASILVSHSLKLLPKPKIIVSYADTSQNHVGYIYQATNFVYTGMSTKRTEWRMKGSNKHSKTITEQSTLKERIKNTELYERVERPRKHRYIYIVADKKIKKEIKKNMLYEMEPYPKGESKNYDSGGKVSKQLLLL
tara:strand:+ start:123 stop:776 length:654 start_codon:yes stop_codon:yes gene_type:complete